LECGRVGGYIVEGKRTQLDQESIVGSRESDNKLSILESYVRPISIFLVMTVKRIVCTPSPQSYFTFISLSREQPNYSGTRLAKEISIGSFKDDRGP